MYYLDGFTAQKTGGGLAITDYSGNVKNLVIPSEIDGLPVIAIGTGSGSPFALTEWNESFLQLTSIVIPDSVTVINPGVFISHDLFGSRDSSGRYLSGVLLSEPM